MGDGRAATPQEKRLEQSNVEELATRVRALGPPRGVIFSGEFSLPGVVDKLLRGTMLSEKGARPWCRSTG